MSTDTKSGEDRTAWTGNVGCPKLRPMVSADRQPRRMSAYWPGI